MATRSVLVIEDNAKNMKLVRLLLEMGDYRVLEAVDAETGMDICRRNRPDLILMDIQLPGMDGLEATRRIKKDPQLTGIPVVALTSYAMTDDKTRALGAGCDGYLAKPIDTNSFLEVIGGYLPSGTGDAPSSRPAPNRNGARILVVDDDPKNVKLICGMLSREEYDLSVAGDGFSALAKVAENPPDLILLDVMMPGLDGYDVTRRLKAGADTEAIPIILVTALNSPKDRARGLEAGAEEFLTKPVNPVEIEARVQSMLKLKRYRDQLTIRNRSEDRPRADDPKAGSPDNAGRTRRILIIDDDSKALKLIHGYLDSPGYRIEVSHTGSDAVDTIEREPFDLILLDILLPDIDGFEICRRIKQVEHAKDTQVVFLTCLSDMESRIRGIELGADDYLAKPIDPRELRARVTSLLKKKSYLDSLHHHYETALTSALQDGLTGLYNHSYFKRFLDLEIKRSQRHRHTTSLLMIDLDDFKQINDSLGHLAGDMILQNVGLLIKKSTREIDVPARYGGEEFAIVLPYGDRYGTGVVGERLRGLIENQVFAVPGTEEGLRVTVSIGGAVYPDDADTASQLIETADQMLYIAKGTGKNRVVIYDAETPPPVSLVENG